MYHDTDKIETVNVNSLNSLREYFSTALSEPKVLKMPKKIHSAILTHWNPITQKIKKPSVNPPYNKLLRGVALCTNWEGVGFVPSSSHSTNCFYHWPNSYWRLAKFQIS